jgi:hypothetical protein
MSPPTEQLIRDYLNRLSVAARDRLGADDRRALVDRTRKLIERKADFAGRPTMLEVGKVLARLGDPAALVEQEWRRLAAVRGETPDGMPQPAGAPPLADPDDSRELAESADPPSTRRFLNRILHREPGRAWRSDSGWPTAVPIENGTSGSTAGVPGTAQLEPPWPSAAAQDGGTAPYPHPDAPVRNGTVVGTALTPADNGRADAGPGAAVAVNGTTANPTDTTTDTTAASETGTGDEPEQAGRAGMATRPIRLLRSLASRAWQQPLEATAIILLGLGGAIFPPVFVLGALVALGSKLWHYRDKWVGLVLPPVLTIIGAAAGIAIGGRSHGLHDGWVFLNILSRVAAVLGAGYLAWRTGTGRRPPPSPPWHKPHGVA